MTAGVYVIKNTISGRAYVGFGLDVLTRMTAHIRSLGLGHHFSKRLQADWDAFGADAFDVALVEEVSGDLDAQVAAEERWIREAMESSGGAYNRHRSCQSRAAYVRRYQQWREQIMLAEQRTDRPKRLRRQDRAAPGGE